LRATRFSKFLAIPAIIGIAASFSGCAQIQARVMGASTTPSNSAESALVAGINNFRCSHGLRPLAVHPTLVNKARVWSGYMANGGCGRGGGGVANICHSHLSDGINVTWSLLGENVGMVSPQSNVSGMESAFEHSPPHAENMLNGQINYVGVGVAYVGNDMYVTEEFMAG
jgi:uncharacterized protein YkwD